MEDEVRQLRPDAYPPLLREIPQVPPMLTMRGSFPTEGTKYLAVVGSRALSSYGREACRRLIEGLRGYPISIVSGLALGADAEAHEAALSAGLHTIAVPGSGLHDAYIAPRTNLGLAHRILAAHGALLSEHPPETSARPEYFPSRNRIMAGLSHATLMIEASEKSGTLITARLAVDYNRELLAVPHRIGDAHGFGPHLFLRLGASLASESAHIIEALGLEPRHASERDMPELTDAEAFVYERLAEPATGDELIREAAFPARAILTALMTLELKELVREEFGAWRRT